MKNKIKRAAAAVSAIAMSAMQLAAFPVSQSVTAATQFPFVIEGEDMKGATPWIDIYGQKIEGYSGSGFWYLTNDSASLEVDAPAEGMYQITVHGAQILNKEGRKQAMNDKIEGSGLGGYIAEHSACCM